MYLKYDGFFDRVRRYYFRKILMDNNISSISSVLDYGCGPGDFLEEAKVFDATVVGIDRYERSIDIATKRGLDVRLGDEKNAIKENEMFDLIILQSVIEHIEEPLAVLLQLKKHLKEGGVFIISAPTPGDVFWDDPTHVRPYTPKSLDVFGELLNMKVEYVSYVAFYLLGIKMRFSLFYKVMNLMPVSLGSNLIAVYRNV